jgi:transposase
MLEDILTRQLCAANGWRIIGAEYDGGQRLVVRLEPIRHSAVCSGCGETKRRFHDVKGTREWRHLDAWNVHTLVVASLRRVRCRWCGIRVERVPWARARSRFTHQFEAEALSRARHCSIQGVCRQLAMHWTSVMRLIERWVQESAERQFRLPLRRIGVDEVNYGRGSHKFLTIVWDHDRSRIVWIGHGRDRATFEDFFQRLGRRRCGRLVAVTMDMAPYYIAAARHHAALSRPLLKMGSLRTARVDCYAASSPASIVG